VRAPQEESIIVQFIMEFGDLLILILLAAVRARSRLPASPPARACPFPACARAPESRLRACARVPPARACPCLACARPLPSRPRPPPRHPPPSPRCLPSSQSIASFALKEYLEGAAVLVTIFLNAGISVYTERSASNALAALASLSQPFANAVRDGVAVKVATRELVKGDLVVLGLGDVIPADLRLVASTDLKVNEMPLTGESIDVAKNAGARVGEAGKEALTPAHSVFSSTTITSGGGRGVVIGTGMHTRVGEIARMLKGNEGDAKRNCLGAKEEKRTPLQEKLHRMGLVLSLLALLGCGIVFAVGMGRGYKDPSKPDQSTFLAMVLVAVSLAVSAIPEGLPLAVTICLALGTKAMARMNALAKSLPAVETLGSATVICSDKTGTITEGKMTAIKAFLPGVPSSAKAESLAHEQGGRRLDITGRGVFPVGEITFEGTDLLPVGVPMESAAPVRVGAGAAPPRDLQAQVFLAAGLLNSTAELKVMDKPVGGAAKAALEPRALTAADVELIVTGGAEKIVARRWVAEGQHTECPIVMAAAKAGLLALPLAAKHPTVAQRAAGKAGPEVPFSSSRKMCVSVVHADDGAFVGLPLPGSARLVVLVKGAPNYVLDRTTSALHPDGTVQPLGADEKASVMAMVDDLSSQALRVIALCIRPLDALPYDAADSGVAVDDKFRTLASELTLVGLIASMDPERVGVKDAVATARTAGIRVVMITGDYRATAVAIAKNVGLIGVGDDADECAVDCGVLRPRGDGLYIAEPDMDELTSRVNVYARAKPEDKMQIIHSLQRQGHIAAMTGDGVNDAPALNAADIGVAMGIGGTEVAKGAADFILMDDNFCTIVRAVEKGRSIFTNIQTFTTRLLGANVTQIWVILISIAIGIPVCLEPLAILFLNIVLDSPPSVALSLDPIQKNAMTLPPRDPNAPLINRRMWIKVAYHSLLCAGAVLGSFILGLYWHTGHILLDDLTPGSCEVFDPSSNSWSHSTDEDCAKDGLGQARAMAFITIVFSEQARAFSVRTDNPLWVGFFSNIYLLYTFFISIILALILVLVPGAQDVIGAATIKYHGWLTALAFAAAVLLLDELLKVRLRAVDERIAERADLKNDLQTILLELRQLRAHVNGLEDKLHVRKHKPASRLGDVQESARVLAQALESVGVRIGPAGGGGAAAAADGAVGHVAIAVAGRQPSTGTKERTRTGSIFGRLAGSNRKVPADGGAGADASAAAAAPESKPDATRPVAST
jgi:magnesium-transporting ATPase (P-type)